MKDYYKDSVCIVTGAGSGIGEKLAEFLTKAGAKVVFGTDINEERLNSVKTKLYNFQAVKHDVTDYKGFQNLINDIVKKYGKLDFIFNNAGIGISGEAHELSFEQWKKILDINLYGVVNGSYPAYKQMVKQGHGHIVNISSVLGFFPLPLEAPYVTSKFGVLGLSLALRVEGALKGVKVSAVCPGLIKTAIFDNPNVNINMRKFLDIVEREMKSSATPEECARDILLGVSKNKAVIPITSGAKKLHLAMRFFPKLMLKKAIKDLKRILPQIKTTS